MSQAFEKARLDYGDYNTWDSNFTRGDGEAQLKWLQKYLLPYIKYTETDVIGPYARVGLANGSGFSSYDSLVFFCVKYKDCLAKPEGWNTRNRFIFFLPTQGSNMGFSTYMERRNVPWNGTREEIINGKKGCTQGCSKSDSAQCSSLIQFDGWQIKDDYPW